VFVFPSFFEGLALVLLEAMACGLPAIASAATGGADVLTEASGRLLPVGDLDGLVDALRWFDRNRSRLPAMGKRQGKRRRSARGIATVAPSQKRRLRLYNRVCSQSVLMQGYAGKNNVELE
jgi:glycosyltransferase involved in cell wall biosynthesis